MLALTTYFEPRNLLIDLAFLGLSTITSERSPPPARNFLADFVFSPGTLGRARLRAGRLPLLGLGLGGGSVFRSGRSGGLSWHGIFLLIFLRVHCLGRSVSTRDHGDEGPFEVAPAKNPDTMKHGPAIERDPASFLNSDIARVSGRVKRGVRWNHPPTVRFATIRGTPCRLRSFAAINASCSRFSRILAMFGFVVSDSVPRLLSSNYSGRDQKVVDLYGAPLYQQPAQRAGPAAEPGQHVRRRPGPVHAPRGSSAD